MISLHGFNSKNKNEQYKWIFEQLNAYIVCSSRDTRKYYALTRLKSYVHCEAPKKIYFIIDKVELIK